MMVRPAIGRRAAIVRVAMVIVAVAAVAVAATAARAANAPMDRRKTRNNLRPSLDQTQRPLPNGGGRLLLSLARG